MGKLGLVFLPLWSAGHLIPMVETAKRLLQHQTLDNLFSITVLVIKPPNPASISTISSYIQSVSSSGLDIRFHNLPPVDPPADSHGVEDFISVLIQSHKPHVEAAVTQSSIPVAALVLDMFGTTMIDVAHKLGISAYIFFTSTAAMLAATLHLPALHDRIPVEFEDLAGDVDIPGVPPVPPLCMPSPFLNKKSPVYTWFLYHGKRFLEARGIIVNTLMELEPGPLKAMMQGLCAPSRPSPAIYPVGPVIALEDSKDRGNSERHECLKWLDGQPPASVVFLCFGSMGSFGAPQVREMALGMERSGHRFLWCLRAPSTGRFRHQVDANLAEVLPEGFLERNRGRGLVWPSWVPQKEILAHQAVGGFVNHCGWNSILESLWFGVPMLGWPLFAEQHLNALEMAREIGVAMELKVDRKGGGFVGAEELERGVRCLMGDSEEGRKVRAKAADMRLASRKALGEGGSSYVYMEKLAEDIRNRRVSNKC
ncbi:UDP-glycosyltransferase 71K1-like [Phoenix dactylifera]|uniref:UDP-glycosyltransferase 71K1-like n=1 Tax=Phoenix dactylifera TaxID=42345 RepID=A0A8B7BGH7_PHODC|nr:UDP-glycosyltransferase 71K1-like [Phoenix dactylifera]